MNFPDYKRFLEWYMADGAFRTHFKSAPGEALRSVSLEPDAGLDFLRALGDGCDRYDFQEVAARFPDELAGIRRFIEKQAANEFPELCRQPCLENEPFEAWRMRQTEANRARLQPRYFDQVFHISVAFELSAGCSGGCPFCCFDAPPLRENFRYTPENRRLWRNILRVFRQFLGRRAGAAALYWATDPFDNPDLEKFYEDFYEINRIWPPITTRWPLRDPERTRKFAAAGKAHGQPGCRFSIVKLDDLAAFFREFSAEESLFWNFVLNNPESLNRYSACGRARKDVPPEKCQEDTSSCCLSGFLVNCCRKTVKLLSPAPPCNAEPYGFHLWYESGFQDADGLRAVLEHLQEKFFIAGPEKLPFLRLSPNWICETKGNLAEFHSRFLKRTLRVTEEEIRLLAQLRCGVDRAEYQARYSGELAALSPAEGLVKTLWKLGMLEETADDEK